MGVFATGGPVCPNSPSIAFILSSPIPASSTYDKIGGRSSPSISSDGFAPKHGLSPADSLGVNGFAFRTATTVVIVK
jgi:hypothetical protein